MTTKEITITATSGGYYSGKKAQISLDGQEIGFGNYSRGLNIAVFDGITGKPLFATSFDTPIGAADIFANSIDSLPDGRIVALVVKGDAGQLTDKAKQACKSLGSDQIDQLQPYQSYALVGIKGHSPGTATESIAWSETSASHTAEVETVVATGGFVVEAISKPSTVGADYSVTGGEAEIKLNGSTLTIQGGTKPGWNLAVLDGKDGQIKTSGSFNPWIPAQVDELVETIDNVELGDLVAIATKDYAGTQVERKVIKACASIGSTMVGNLQYGGNWAIVGYQGAKPGRVGESLSPYSPAEYQPQGLAVNYWVLLTAPVGKQLKLGPKLSEPDATPSFGFWQAASIDGDYAFIGQRQLRSIGESDLNKVYVYHWQNGQWQLQQQLRPSGQSGNGYASAIDVSGNFAIVGQYAADASDDKYNCGAAHIYQLKGGRWQHQKRLQPSDLKVEDSFGGSVAIDGDGKVAIVSARQADAPGKNLCGAVYIFHLERGNWVQKAKLQPNDLAPNDRLSFNLSIDSNVAIVGNSTADAPGKDNCGAAYIFQLQDGRWVQKPKLQPPDLAAGDFFGRSVAIADNWAIVGSSADVSGKENVGAAYIFQLQDGQWKLYQKIFPSDLKAKSSFSSYVGIGNDVALVVARDPDGNGNENRRVVYVFQLINNRWEQTQKLQPPELPANSIWGVGLDFDGNRAIIGSDARKSTPAKGFAYICDLTEN